MGASGARWPVLHAASQGWRRSADPLRARRAVRRRRRAAGSPPAERRPHDQRDRRRHLAGRPSCSSTACAPAARTRPNCARAMCALAKTCPIVCRARSIAACRFARTGAASSTRRRIGRQGSAFATTRWARRQHQDREIFGEGFGASDWIGATVSENGKHLLLSVSHGWASGEVLRAGSRVGDTFVAIRPIVREPRRARLCERSPATA